MTAENSKSLRGLKLNLRERIHHLDKEYERTGFLYGIEKMTLMESDPTKFEKFVWRLISAANGARETSKYVSGSPAAVGMSELVNMLALPEGDVVVSSAGLAGHTASFPIMIRRMVEEGYEENPGIRETDIWGCNDTEYGCPHPADEYTFIPLVYDGKLIGWTAGANHVADTGHAICAGGVPVYSPTTYCDGLVYGPMKMGEKVGNDYIHYRSALHMFERRTRTGSLNILDEKMRLAGSVILANKVFEIIKDFGLDYFERGVREVIERERRIIANRFRKWMVPGHYRQTCYRPVMYKGIMTSLFPQADKNWFHQHNNFMHIKTDGTCISDASGTSSETTCAYNGTEGAYKMGATFANLGFICQSPIVNTSLFYVINYVRPPGSMVDPIRKDVSTCFGNAMGSWHGTMMVRSWALATYLKGYLEEAYLMEHEWELYGVEGVFKNDLPWAMGNFTYEGAEPRGPSSWRDGEALVLGAGNPDADFGEAEEWEFCEPPLLIISRSMVPDFCCHGRQRGAIGMALTQLVVEPGKYLTLNASGYGGSLMNATAVGMCGGYPCLNSGIMFFRDTNAFELVQKGEKLPVNFVEAHKMVAEGKFKVGNIVNFGGHETPPVMLKHGDMVCVGAHAGSAWGDPLERKIELVEKDVDAGWISPEVAKNIYGVVMRQSGQAWQADVETSKKARLQIRKKRKARSIPAKELYKQERKKVLKKDYGFPEINEMFMDITKYDIWWKHFSSFWQLGEDYKKEGAGAIPPADLSHGREYGEKL